MDQRTRRDKEKIRKGKIVLRGRGQITRPSED